MGILIPKNKKAGRAAVQTAPQPPQRSWQPQRFLPAEAPLYDALRQSVPIIEAALQKIVRLTVDFTVRAADPAAQPLLERFAAEVPVGASGVGLETFACRYLDSLLCYGNAVGEVVLNHRRDGIAGLYLPPLGHLSFTQGDTPLEAVICTGSGCDRHPLPCPELVLFTALHPAPGSITGQSLLFGLPAVSRVLLQIYSAIGQNFERMGNLRYAVTYRPAPGDQTDAAAVAGEISREWSAAMQAAAAGEIRDFVAVGDVDIRVIGADNQFISTEVPVRQLLEQIVALAREKELVLLSDEIYDRLVMDGKTHVSTASLCPDLPVLTFNGLSKSHMICGFRCGWLCVSGPRAITQDFIAGMVALTSMRLCGNALTQLVIPAALADPDSTRALLVPGGRLYEQREAAVSALRQFDCLSVVKNSAAFYIFPRIDLKKCPITDDKKFAMDLLHQKHILLVPGSGFDWPQPDHFRVVMLPQAEELSRAMTDVGEFLQTYRQ